MKQKNSNSDMRDLILTENLIYQYIIKEVLCIIINIKMISCVRHIIQTNLACSN